MKLTKGIVSFRSELMYSCMHVPPPPSITCFTFYPVSLATAETSLKSYKIAFLFSVLNPYR